jgi:drug/metabolite transporter (DMT)-like permease
MVFYLPIVLIVAATAGYHIAQKSVPPQVSPMVSLLVNYVTALVITLIFLPFYPRGSNASFAWSLKQVNWASYAVGVCIFGVELAVLLSYRVGWKLSLASLVANVATALVLALVGLSFFSERLSVKNVAGIGLCLAGLLLLAQR